MKTIVKANRRIIKRFTASLIALALIFGLVSGNSIVTVKAATSNASLSGLGYMGTVNIGNKSESGYWYQTKVGGKDAFCMDLGLACHTGDVFESTSKTISSSSSNKKNALEAKVGHWYYETKKESRKAWIYAQCLIWAVEEGCTSKTELTDIIKQVRSNTGYYDSKTAAGLYTEIFGGATTVECKVTIWTYSGSGSSRQKLMRIESDKPDPPRPSVVSDTKRYRQRITLHKEDENGSAVPQVTFKLTAKNIKELYSFKYNGWGDAESGETEDDQSVFEVTSKTDSNGKITFKFDYQIHSDEYAYVKADVLEDMTAAEKRDMKEELDDKGYRYASNLTKSGADELVEKDIQNQLKKISNKYVITEVSTGNSNMVLNSEWKSGKTITLASANSWTKVNGEWPDTADGTYGEYKLAYKPVIVNDYKKASIKVIKEDSYAADGKAHGEASLDGAQYRLFADAACTRPATVYDNTGKTKTAGTYTVKNGTFTTDYLKAGVNYYLKETKAPEGYLLNTKVETVRVDGAALKDIEFTPNAKTVEVKEAPKLGRVEIFKIMSDGESGTGEFENKAEFQIYLKSKGSYEKASEYERDLLITNEKGYAISKNLYVGTYILHQTGSGDFDTIFVPDMEIEITENGEVKTYPLTNKPFKAFLKIVKKDGDTNKTVLKPDTKYQIFKVEKDGTETQVVQSYSNGNGIVKIDTFITDSSGEIMTVKPLRFGKYRIYEVDTATGLFIKDKFIEVEINSKLDNYEMKTDADGNSYALITLEYINYEAKGRFTIEKTGERLKDFATVKNDNLNTGGVLDEVDMPMVEVTDKQFNYKEQYLKGQVFEVYALEDIVTQDNQGTNWFNAGDKVAVITTGLGAEFTSECNGICTYTLNNDTGAVTLTLPLGKYEVREDSTLHGLVVPETNRWELEFNWENADTEFVLNSTNVTDKNGVLHIKNDRAKAEVNLIKKDASVETGVADAVFGFYTKDNIYNAEGIIIAEAGELLKTVTTDKDGKARLDLDLPLMSEGYSMDEGADNTGLNSGDYYFKEQDISASYYLDEEPVYIHLEYKDDKTPIIEAEAVKSNKQTDTEISKVKLADSIELPGCSLKVTDSRNNEILSWISGDRESVKISEKLQELGYRNLTAEINEKGNLTVKGLLHDEEYTLTETKPEDGYATAENITFKLTEAKDKDGNVITKANIKSVDGTFTENQENKVVMKDDTTKIHFYKFASNTNTFLPGTKWKILDENGKEVYNFTTENKATVIEGILAVGKTYTFVEVEAVKNYDKVKDFKFTVKDTADIQDIKVTDKYLTGKITTDTPDNFKEGGKVTGGTSPLTGYFGEIFKVLMCVIALLTSAGVAILSYKKSRQPSEQED